ncbi:MAG: lysophospholipid acyltransferase family protein [Caldilineaceae bacterium]
MKIAVRRFLRAILVRVGWLLCHLLFKPTIVGVENFPRDPKSLLVISNHFSWFDAPIISLLLPYPPAYLIATEAMDRLWINIFSRIFESIPIWRGQVDRKAMTRAVHVLREGGVVGIFPEGGINPELAAVVASGQQIETLDGNMGRMGRN